MSEHRKIFRWIAAVLTVMCILVMIYYVTFETGHFIHECTGSQCPICHEIHIAESMIRQMGAALLFCAAVILYAVYEYGKCIIENSMFPRRTLILDRVRMDR